MPCLKSHYEGLDGFYLRVRGIFFNFYFTSTIFQVIPIRQINTTDQPHRLRHLPLERAGLFQSAWRKIRVRLTTWQARHGTAGIAEHCC